MSDPGGVKVLAPTPRTFLVFIDETGNEDFSDPKNPTFGLGGCGILAPNYKAGLFKPWRRLKRDRLGGALRPFHAVDFEHSRPSMPQIAAINGFLRRPFWRFAVMSDVRTQLPPGIDAHKAVSTVAARYFTRHAAQQDIDTMALIFEDSDRGRKLVQRDFDLAAMTCKNRRGMPVSVDGYFMPKVSAEPGLEIADLIAHTAGRQRRHEVSGGTDIKKDFKQMYWHSPIPPSFMAINSVQLTDLLSEGPPNAVTNA